MRFVGVEHLEQFRLDRLPPERARQIRSNGGKAGAVTRRRKKALREAAEVFLSLPVKDQRTAKKLASCGVDPEDVDNQMAIIAALSLQAAKGDTRAARIILELADNAPQKPVLEVRIVDDL